MPRGRRRGSPDTRSDILDAARREFADFGYRGATIRAIAARASVDPSLVLHYFESKEQLFAQSLDVPFSPAAVMRTVFESGTEEVGVRLVTAVLSTWDAAGNTDQLTAAFRSATGSGPVHDLVREFVHAAILGSLLGLVDDDQPELRAGLIAAQLSGLLVGRYLLELEPLVEADPDVLASAIGPAIDRYAFGQLTRA
jgi:AcrR family transcriptional regulator